VTIAVAVGKGVPPLTSNSISFSNNWQTIVLETGIKIAENVITNYLRNKFSGKKIQENSSVQDVRNSRRYKGTQHWPWKRKFSKSHYKRYRSRSKVYRRGRYNYSGRQRFR